jgi:hydrogenase expression/formation protein HypE
MATTLIEIAESSRLHVGIEEDKIAVQESVRGACEILGFDPLYLANEGRFIAFVPARDAERALAALQPVPVSRGAAIVGFVDEGTPRSAVTLKTTIGTQRVLDMLSGEQLPRIC